MNIDLRSLTAFLRIIEAGSFSAAARAHGISQPALSRTIKLLEEQIGERLFDRDTRNLSLTAVGHELKVVADRLVGDFAGSLERISEFAKGTRGTVTVAAVPTLAATLVPPAIASFRQTHPDVTVVIRDGLTQMVTEAVAEGSVDFALTVRPPQHKELSYKPLLTDRFVAVGHAADDVGQYEAVDWAYLAERPFIAFDKNSSVRMMTDAAFVQAGLSIEPRYECSELATVGGMLMAGLGVTAMPQLALRHLLQPGLSYCPLKEPVMARSLGVITSSRRVLAPPAKQFLSHLTAQAARSEFAAGRNKVT